MQVTVSQTLEEVLKSLNKGMTVEEFLDKYSKYLSDETD